MEKDGLSSYWDLIETPIIVFFVYALLALVLQFGTLLGSLISSILSIAVLLFVFGLSSYNSVKFKKGRPAKVGAYSGVLVGLISALVAILTFYFFPQVFADAIKKAVGAGASSSTARTAIQIGLYINIIILPVFYAAVGALIAWVSSYVFVRNKSNKKKH